MLPVLCKLLWKEFHELKWAVVATAAISLTLPLGYAFRDPELAASSVGITYFVYPFFAAAFFGAHLAAGERVSRTAAFLSALPIRRQWIGIVKLLSTCLAVVTPLAALLVTGLLVRLLADDPVAPSAVVLLKACAVSGSITVFLVITVGFFGIGAPTEVRAAVPGLAAFVLWALAASASTQLAYRANLWQPSVNGLHPSRSLNVPIPFSPGHNALVLARFVRYIGPPLDGLAAVSSPENHSNDLVAPWATSRFVLLPLTLALLALSFVVRYPRALEISPPRRLSTWPLLTRIPLWLSSPLLALMWKNLREMLPMSVGVLLCSLLLGLLTILSTNSAAPWADRVRIGMGMFGVSACIAGFVLALLIGTGSFVSDLESRVNTFWRSRPISPAQWYWTKYFTGLVLLGMFGLPAIICTLTVVALDVNLQELLWLIPLWLVVYSLAVTATCLVRHTVHAAILSLGVTGLIFAAVEIVAGSAFRIDGPRAPLSTIAAAFLVAFLVSTFAGARAAITDTKVST